MSNYIIEKVKRARNYISPVLRNEIINTGLPIVGPLITLLPSLNSYVVMGDLLELIGYIGGDHAHSALITLLEDVPEGNLPQRLISRSCIKGLSYKYNSRSIGYIIKSLSYYDAELRLTAISALTKIALIDEGYREKIIESLKIAYDNETFEKPGLLLVDSLYQLGYIIQNPKQWTNKVSVMRREPEKFEPMVEFRPTVSRDISIESLDVQNSDFEIVKTANIKTQNKVYTSDNKYKYLTEEEQKEVLDKLLTCPDEEEKYQIIEALGKSGNNEVIDELLTVLKSTDNRKTKSCAVDAILNIVPNDTKLRFLILEYILDKRVIGQDEAKLALANALRVAQIGLKKGSNSNKPIGSFLFLGPTGVGKTELAKALAEALYGNELKLIRIDMSEYTDMADKNKLIGSPPGYAGSDEGGRLTQAVLKEPKSVVLFDEVEKAHPEIFNLFLQLLDDGRLTDSKGITVSFADTLIILTSNVGSEYILEGLNQKFTIEDIKELVNEKLKEKFKPEFLNRLNEYIIFKPLTALELMQVLLLKLNPTRKSLKKKYNLKFEITDNAKSFIIEKTQKQEFGFSPRELNRIIDEEIIQPLSETLLDIEIAQSYKGKNLLPKEGSVLVDEKDSRIIIEIVDSSNKEVPR